MNLRKKQSAVAVPDANPREKIQPRGLRVSEAATYIGGTISLVRTLIQSHEIPVIVLGKRHVLLRESLDEYLDMQKRRA
jgi:excisionase family DNA binding protein